MWGVASSAAKPAERSVSRTTARGPSPGSDPDRKRRISGPFGRYRKPSRVSQPLAAASARRANAPVAAATRSGAASVGEERKPRRWLASHRSSRKARKRTARLSQTSRSRVGSSSRARLPSLRSARKTQSLGNSHRSRTSGSTREVRARTLQSGSCQARSSPRWAFRPKTIRSRGGRRPLGPNSRSCTSVYSGRTLSQGRFPIQIGRQWRSGISSSARSQKISSRRTCRPATKLSPTTATR